MSAGVLAVLAADDLIRLDGDGFPTSSSLSLAIRLSPTRGGGVETVDAVDDDDAAEEADAADMMLTH